ncbi:MAG: GNAT family N-acetyltransferase [Rhodobacteraceae bacterium]|nr:GNAT family N-acetyltransferase [Paracoccaceae bacterium]
MLRRLELDDMGQAAAVHRAAFDVMLPRLIGLHTVEEDRWFYRERLFPVCQIWGSFDGQALAGIIAFQRDWIDQFYVLPSHQGRGIGTALLQVAQGEFDHLALWTFQRNHRARRFYEQRGFVELEQTDGAHNEENEPDVMYAWTSLDFGQS